MFRIFTSFFKQTLFWLVFFAFGRLVFLIFYSEDVFKNADTFTEVLASFIYGFKLDLATTCYFMLFPFLLHLVLIFYSPKWISKLNQAYHAILIVIYSLLIVGEIGIYAEWRSKLNFKAILYLKNPSEVIGSAQNSQIIILSLIAIAMSVLGIWVYSRFFHSKLIRLQTPVSFGLVFFIIMPPLLVLGARGGVQEIPINQSQSFYSKHSILNAAATNTVFNLFISFIENQKHLNNNPFKSMNEVKANSILNQIYKTPKDSCIHILTKERPNIVLVILESWSSDLIDIPEGKKEVAPEFKKLIKNGVYFNNCYSTGFRSEQGMASIFGGFPAHPISSITVQPDKYLKLPSIIKDLNNEGYFTSFSFGGQLIYGNIKSYILYNEFDLVKEIYDFDENIPQGKLGIHDEYMFDELVKDMNVANEPFLSALFTMSSHSPYDQPKIPSEIKWGDNEQQYLNASHYTDKCIGEFIRNARKQDWYDNTLFIFVSDHSHNSYKNNKYRSHEYQKIPMLFYGNVIDSAYRGKKVEQLGIQTNLAATLLCQLGMNTENYHWSVNMLNPYAPEFAYTSYEEGFNWVRPVGVINYEQRFNRYHFNTVPEHMTDSISDEGKAFMQVLFQEYIDH